MITKKLYEPVYRVHLFFVADCDFKTFKKKIENYGFQAPDDSHEQSDGLHAEFNDPNNGICHVVWIRQSGDLACLVHEVTHLTIAVFDHKGIRIQDTDITEAVAYYLEHWVTKLWPFLRSNPKKKLKKRKK